MKKLFRITLLSLAIITSLEGQSQQVPVWKLVDLKKAMDSAAGPTVINFWATFCKPCIAELPHFQAMANQYKAAGVKLIMVSLDLKEAYPKKIVAFAKNRKLTSPVVFLDESDADLFVPAVDSSWSGAIPASLFINPQKNYRFFIEDELSKDKLDAEVKKMLSGTREG